jgi:hypothetical protein
MGQRELISADLERNSTIKVNASRVFNQDLACLDDVLSELKPLADSALCLNAKAGEGGEATINAYTKLVEARAKLAAERGKMLVEMQKDLNRCCIERERIRASAAKDLDLSKIPIAAIEAALEDAE